MTTTLQRCWMLFVTDASKMRFQFERTCSVILTDIRDLQLAYLSRTQPMRRRVDTQTRDRLGCCTRVSTGNCDCDVIGYPVDADRSREL